MNTLRKFVPLFVKKIIIFFYVLFRLSLRGQAASEIRLNLAGVLPPPESLQIVHGGKVKLLHLRERFGDSWRGFNLAYFVSSGLPFSPAIWLKLYKLFGIKIVWNQNGVYYPALSTEKVVNKVNGLMSSIHESHYVFYQSKFVKYCADKFLGQYAGESEILYNPIDTDHFTPRETPLPLEPLVLLTTINHSSLERLEITLRTLKALIVSGRKAKLIILGSVTKAGWPEARKDLKRLTKELGLETAIELKGAYLQKDAPRLFQQGHIFIHLKDLDPCPTLILEAQACGLPVVGSRSGGMPELVGERAGILIEVSEDFSQLHYPSVEAVKEAIIKIASNISEYRSEARKQAELPQFSKEHWLERHQEIFEKLCRSSQ